MDTRITKARIGTHFEYDWIKYLAVIVASIALWLVVYSSLNSVPDEDKIGFFCVGNFYPDLDSKRYAVLERNLKSDFGMKEITQQSSAFYERRADGTYSESMTLSTIVQTSFLYNDFVIAPRAFFEEYISVKTAGTYFLSIDDVLAEGYYFTSEADKAALAYIEAHDAFYTYEYLPKDLQKYEDGEMVDMTEEEIEALKAAPDTTNGKRFGVVLNKIPGLDEGFVFRFDDKLPETDENGDPLPAEQEEYILGIVNGYGLNVGTFNREAQLISGCGKNTTPHADRADAFSIFTGLFTVIDNPDSLFDGLVNAAKYAPQS